MSFPDGVLIVDKPAGPTSHDVVAVARRAAATKVGHTGTLDPLASGVLPLVLGRATRLAQFLSSSDKEYEAEVRLGVSTTTFDRAGDVITTPNARPVSGITRSEVEAAVAAYRGVQMQQPPTFSAKKVDGERAYDLARRKETVRLQPSEVTAHELEIVEWDGARLRLRLVCSAGFYVRALAQGIGERLGTGAHLAALVRTRSGDFALTEAISLDVLAGSPEEAAGRVIRLNEMLPSLPGLTLTAKGAVLASRGGFISPDHVEHGQPPPGKGKVRLLHPDGRLIAIAEERPAGPVGLLHPGVVLE